MIKKKIRHIHIHIVFVTFFKYLNLFLSICYTCYLYWKLRSFLKKEKVSPKVLKRVVFFVCSIDFAHPHRSTYQLATGHCYQKSWLGPTSRFCRVVLVSTTIFKRVSEPPSKFVRPPTIKFLSLDHF